MRHFPWSFCIIAIGLLVAGVAIAQDTPSINCREAASEVETTICSSPELKAMDREIAALYDEARAGADASEREAILNDQRAFLDLREACVAKLNSAHPGVATYECIQNAMSRRVKALQADSEN